MAYRPDWNRRGAGIDVTPLVNVALILLIVFMVVTPMNRQGIQVNLPPAEHGKDSSRAKENQVVVSIRANGELFVDLKRVSKQNLERALAQVYRGKEEMPIVIKGDKVLDYGDVLDVMHACRKIGAAGVDLMAMKPGG